MRTNERWIAVMLVLFAVVLRAVPAHAQSRDQNWAYCVNQNRTPAYDLAISACTALIQSGQETTADLSGAFYNRGRAYLLGPQPDYARAIADFTQAIALNPQNAGALSARGGAYLQGPQPDYASAIADLTQAIALIPQDAIVFTNRGYAYMNSPQHDYARAIADFTQAIALNPVLDGAFHNRGLAYNAQHDWVHAIADFDAAAEIATEFDRQNATYENSRCWARAMANRDLDVARAACDASLRLRSGDPNVLDSRGMVGLRQQRWQDAWNDYDAAITSNARGAGHFYGRGIAALRLGRAAAGQADIAHATQLNANIAQTYAGYGITP